MIDPLITEAHAAYAHRIRKRRPTAFDKWHIDEVLVKIGGNRMSLWRAVGGEGEALDVLVQKRRNKRAENSHVPIRRRERKMQRFKPHDHRKTRDKCQM